MRAEISIPDLRPSLLSIFSLFLGGRPVTIKQQQQPRFPAIIKYRLRRTGPLRLLAPVINATVPDAGDSRAPVLHTNSRTPEQITHPTPPPPPLPLPSVPSSSVPARLPGGSGRQTYLARIPRFLRFLRWRTVESGAPLAGSPSRLLGAAAGRRWGERTGAPAGGGSRSNGQGRSYHRLPSRRQGAIGLSLSLSLSPN